MQAVARKRHFNRTQFIGSLNLLYAALAASLLVAPHAASAGYVTLHFNGNATYNFERGQEHVFGWQNQVMPHEDGGYVQGHWDLSSACVDSGLCGKNFGAPYDYDFTPYLGTDPTGCRKVDETGNPVGATSASGYPVDPADYVPLCGTALRLDRGGLPFDVIGFIPIAGGGIYSSKGGAAFGDAGYLVALDGQPWKAVEWIVIEGCDCGSPAGIDDLTLEIPEPGMLALLGTLTLAGGLGGMGSLRRRPEQRTSS